MGIPANSTYISVVSVMELELGALRIARRYPIRGAVLRLWIDNSVLKSFAGRILSVDVEVAQRVAALRVPDPRAEHDALVAATALSYKMTVVTRNVADLELTGVPTINPWEAERWAPGVA